MKSDSRQGYDLHFNFSFFKISSQTLTSPLYSVKTDAPQVNKPAKSIHHNGALVDSSPRCDDVLVAGHLSQKKGLEQCRSDMASGLG
jgi:hypothetical protein